MICIQLCTLYSHWGVNYWVDVYGECGFFPTERLPRRLIQTPLSVCYINVFSATWRVVPSVTSNSTIRTMLWITLLIHSTMPISTNRMSAVEPFNKLLHPRLPACPVLAKNNKCFHCVYVLLFILYILHPPKVSNHYCACAICWQSSRVLRTVPGS